MLGNPGGGGRGSPSPRGPDRPQGRTTRPPFGHSLGAFGFFPWVDFGGGLFGAFMVRGSGDINAQTIPAYRDMLTAIEAELAGGSCDWIEHFDAVFVDDLEAR